jgi:hypothetical protein
VVVGFEAVGSERQRGELVRLAQAFKGSWLELARVLAQARSLGRYRAWGFDDFYDYCAKELRLRRATVDKLVGSYHFVHRETDCLDSRPPWLDGGDRAVPPLRSVQLLERALERPDMDDEVKAELRREVLQRGAGPGRLARRLQSVEPPPPSAGGAELGGQKAASPPSPALVAEVRQVVGRLATLLADHPTLLSKALAAAVEEQLGSLLTELEQVGPGSGSGATSPGPSRAAQR